MHMARMHIPIIITSVTKELFTSLSPFINCLLF